ncbi:MAG TPA: thiamine-phosphate kinase [Gemmatimonadaceae bacterium]
MTTIALGPGEEFDAIRTLLDRWGSRAVGVGDDAAVIDITRGDQLVASVDSAVENRHFRRGWFTPREIGYRAVTAALSDLAAMAARPVGVLIALAVPLDWRSELLNIADGIGDAVTAADTVIRGGNITAATELSITTTVLGGAYRPLARADARAGDFVYVTGTLGGPGATLARLMAGRPAGEHRERLVRPRARLREAQWLAARGARAAIDISDGLVADLRHIAAASSVAITLDAARIPCVAGVGPDDALVSGEEYELVVASPTRFDTNVFEHRFSIPLTEIGAASAMRAGDVRVIGARVAGASGHDHFST